MYKSRIPEINESLAKTRKAIISLGCSFTEGQGAIDDELYTEYNWVNSKILGNGMEVNLTKAQMIEICKKYKNVRFDFTGTKLDFSSMEYDNSFVCALSNKYFDGKYTPINLGNRGCGNRAAVKELYFHPEIDWHLIEECIVIYAPSGLERFDFINDAGNDHFRFKCMWPHYNNMEKNSTRRLLWEGYSKSLYSDKFEVLEQIGHAQELLTWCKLKNARLIITPAFERRYNKEHFRQALDKTIGRTIEGEIISNEAKVGSYDLRYLDLFPWDNIFEPNGYKTFADLVISNEKNLKSKEDYFFQFLNKGSPDGWITPCAHPSAKGHDFFAKTLFEYIITSN